MKSPVVVAACLSFLYAGDAFDGASGSPDGSATDSSAAVTCPAVLPEPGFAPSSAALAMRERFIREGWREVDLAWRTAEEDEAWSLAMPDWMEKISKKILDRIVLLHRKGVLAPGRRHWAADFASRDVPVDSLARLQVQFEVSDWTRFDDELLHGLDGRFVLAVANPKRPGTGFGFVLAWVPPERLRCLAARPDVLRIDALGSTAPHAGPGPAASRR